MGLYRVLQVVVFAGVCTMAAHADTYQFSISGSGVAPVTFTVPSSPTPDGTGSDYFQVDIPDSSIMSGFTGTGGSVSLLFPLGSGGNEFDLDIYGEQADQFFGPILYTGSIEEPTFVTGTFDVMAESTIFVPGLLQDSGTPATLTITDVSAAPEPGSLVLLGTGLLGCVGMVRRRLS